MPHSHTGLLATVPSNANGNGENSTTLMGFQTGDVTKEITASSGLHTQTSLFFMQANPILRHILSKT